MKTATSSRTSHQPRPRSRSRSWRKTMTLAFTLLELVMSMALFSVLSLLLLSVINMTSDISVQTSSRLMTTRVARECLDLIGNDLKLSPPPYFSVNTNTLQLDVNPPGVQGDFNQPGTLFWQSPVSRTDKYGNISIFGYFVMRDLVAANPANNRFQLRRLYVEPENPSSPPGSPEYLLYSSPTNWHPNTLLQQYAPSSAAADNLAAQKGWVADGVLAMWVRCLDPKGNPITKKLDGTAITNYRYDSRDSYQYSGTTATNIIFASATGRPALPAFIEVTLVCISPRDIPRIKALPTPSAANPAQCATEVAQFVASVRTMNPSVKSVDSFTRKFRIYSSRDL